MFSLGYWAIHRFQPCTCTPPRSYSSVLFFCLAFLIKNLLSLTPWFPKWGFHKESVSTNTWQLVNNRFPPQQYAAIVGARVRLDLRDRAIKSRHSEINIYSAHLCLTGHKVDKVRLTLERQHVPAWSGPDCSYMTSMFKNIYRIYNVFGTFSFLTAYFGAAWHTALSHK